MCAWFWDWLIGVGWGDAEGSTGRSTSGLRDGSGVTETMTEGSFGWIGRSDGGGGAVSGF